MGRAAERVAASVAAAVMAAEVMALAATARVVVVGPAVGYLVAAARWAGLKEAAAVAIVEAAAARAAGGVE